ncbi:MAG: DUF2141 domain-containing protein [Gallionellaceae bacterium]|jgi:uncharacterized protein (DUF2141 family)
MRFTALLFALVLPFAAQAGELKLTLLGKGISGKRLFVAVHSNADDFPTKDGKSIQSAVIATGDKTELSITNIAPGEYAVAVFADVNGNRELDSNFIGIPQEPVGISRDAKGKLGPPKFTDASFNVGEGVTTETIHLQ